MNRVRHYNFTFLITVAVLPLLADIVYAKPPSPQAITFFENRIRPLLSENCYECHGSKKQKGHLRLDSRSAILAGGDLGPALVPKNPNKSKLIEAVRYTNADLQMPPKKRLTKSQVADLETWVKMGAPWPGDTGKPKHTLRAREFKITDEDRNWWSFRPIKRPPIPTIRNRDRAANPIDHFILALLQRKGIPLNQPATRRQLIRRAYFDLIGIPPTYQRIKAFVESKDPKAYAKLIDQLLARKEYGERWGRHWLDVVRFAESNGYERDDPKPLAWQYRDYVIRAFNTDKPFNQFIREQIAGDEFTQPTRDSLIATGFYRLGVWDDEPDDKRMAEYDALDDVLSTTGVAFMGLTVGCSRCHNHPFAPVAQKDYYQLLAFFRNIRQYDKGKSASIRALPGGGTALGVTEHGPKPKMTYMLIRGQASSLGPRVEALFPKVFNQPKPTVAPKLKSTGLRTALSQWIASDKNPLTPRVIVNRIWQHHFGRGIVRTPNDLTKSGIPPTHPQLLDYLASEFIANNWSVKYLHKLIMTSAVYRASSSTRNPIAHRLDQANNLFWRQNLQRLSAEAIRDSALFVANQLNPQLGGKSMYPRVSGEVVAGASKPGRNWHISSEADRRRRSVYIFVKRTMAEPMLATFDYADSSSPIGTRPVTTVAPQALILLNSRFMDERALAVAQRIEKEGQTTDPVQLVNHAYRIVLARDANSRERDIAVDYLARQFAIQKNLFGRQVFRPDVPFSLARDYRNRLKGHHYIQGPSHNWAYHTGVWGGGYEGIDVVDINRGPFALHKAPFPSAGIIKARIKLHGSVEHAGILLNARNEGQQLRGLELRFDVKNQSLKLLHHNRSGLKTITQNTYAIHRDKWHAIKIQYDLESRTFSTIIDNASQPTLRTNALPKSVGGRDPSQPSRIGVKSWGGAITLDHMSLISANTTRYVTPSFQDTLPHRQTIRRRAFKALVLVIMNLNEFIYVD